MGVATMIRSCCGKLWWRSGVVDWSVNGETGEILISVPASSKAPGSVWTPCYASYGEVQRAIWRLLESLTN